MHQYVVLANPGHNRVYFDTAFRLASSEIKSLCNQYTIQLEDILEEDLPLPPSLTLMVKEELTPQQLSGISMSSVFYAIFKKEEGDLLRPISVEDFHRYPESMVQILKYNGKTNEQFTRLLVNLAYSFCKTSSHKKTLLDPMCGKGTTLYEALIHGFNVVGVEVNPKWTQELQNFVVRYFKEGKYKHKAVKGKLKDQKSKKVADTFSVEVGHSKEAFKAGDIEKINIYNGDSRKAGDMIKKKSCDMIVCDLPYGVQHGSKQQSNQITSRSPLELIDESIEGWLNVLKSGGTLVLAFNEYTLKFKDISALLESRNLEVINDQDTYIHRVNQSIQRNVIIARK